MKKLLPIPLFCLLVFSGSAQNLVPNPSFEDTIACPNGNSQIDKAVGWSSFGGSPDYYNSCSPWLCCSVPVNNYGYQYAATGNAYCGMVAYVEVGPPFGGREVIGKELSAPLVIGQKYYVSIKVSSTVNVYETCYASSKMGVLFSTVAYDDTTPPLINNFAHIYTDFIITDTVNWTNISSSFIADSAYKYIIIGNFFDDINTDTISIGYGYCDSLNYYASYYYIDDICVSVDSVTCNSGTSIYEYNVQNIINIFPNPSKGKINLQINSSYHKNVTASIYNLLGELTGEYNIQLSDKIINLKNLPDGLYIVKVKIGNQIYIQKLIISK